MKKVNFKDFGVYTDITKETKRPLDLRKAIADKMYSEIPGIAAKDLAFRIYRSEGEMELDDNDIAILMEFMNGCAGALADSFEDAIKEEVGNE